MSHRAAEPRFRRLRARLWRILPEGADPLGAAGHPEGRFHHDGQKALYASLSAEGAGVALATYLRPDDPPRAIWRLSLRAERILDLRNVATCAALGIDPSDAVSRHAEDRAAGRPARSWRAGDAARAQGAQGILYASRKAPGLTHLALFAWGPSAGGALAPVGPPQRWRTP